jgi:phosphate:Na+ symporter
MYLLVAMFLFAAVIWLAATPAVAATTEDNAINWWLMIMQLAGGLALFLYGMEKMGEALKVVAGDRLREVLGKLTTNRIMGLITGTGVTAVIQSSSVTTVMLVGFVSAGVMSLSQAIGVILGADIGTTITAQIVAFKVTKYALGLVAIGFVLVFAGKTEKAVNYGSLIMGLGLIFFGLGVMSAGMKPLRTYEPFIQLMQEVSNPVIGILIATAFTALVQSSSATTGVIIALATQGLITLEGGIALALGANIGTCATAGLACIGKPREAIRVAVAHVTFKIIGVLLIIWFIPPFADFVRLISPASEGLTGIDKLAADTPRQVANAHTLFNVGIAFLFLPFTNQFARFCEWVVPDKPVSAAEEAAALFKPRYLDDLLINTPPLALSMVRRETSRMGEVVEQMLGAVPEAVFVGDVDKMTRVRETDDQVDALYGAINRYLAEVAQHNMGAEFSDEALTFVSVASELENIGDIMETHMYHLTEVCQASDISFSETQLEMLNSYHAKLVSAYKSALAGVEHNRREAAKIALDMEEEIVGGMDKFVLESQARFLREEHTPQEAAAFTLQTDIMENFKRIYEHIKRIARLVTHEEYRTALIVAT